MAATRGICDNCKRPDMALRKIGGGRMVCGTCVLTIQGIPEGPEREKKLAEVAARIQAGGLDKRKATNRKPESGPPSKKKPKLEAIPAGKVPKEAPKNGNGFFPPLTIQFEERDSALADALEAEAIKERRTPDQQILHILEQHYLRP